MKKRLLSDKTLDIVCPIAVVVISLLLLGKDWIMFIIGLIAALFSGIWWIIVSIPLVVWLVLLVLK